MELLKNILPEITLFGSFITFYIVLLAFLSIMLMFSNKNNIKGLFIGTLIFVIINKVYGTLILDFNFKHYILYFLVGIVYSFIKVYFTGRSLGKESKLENEDKISEEKINEDKNRKFRNHYIKSRFYNWLLFWPLSLVLLVVGDFFSKIIPNIIKYFDNLVSRVFSLGFDKTIRK